MIHVSLLVRCLMGRWRLQFDALEDARVRALVRVCDFEPSLTQQSFTTDADLNVLVKRFGIDKGPMPVVPQDPAFYGDVSDVPDLKTALDLVRDAQTKFDALPSGLRRRFDNNPGKMWDFVSDPANADESVALGLLVRAPVPAPPAPAPPVAPPGTAPASGSSPA